MRAVSAAHEEGAAGDDHGDPNVKASPGWQNAKASSDQKASSSCAKGESPVFTLAHTTANSGADVLLLLHATGSLSMHR